MGLQLHNHITADSTITVSADVTENIANSQGKMRNRK